MKFRERENFTQLEVEAALCAWEWMCENRDQIAIWQDMGSAAMRMVSIQAGAIALSVFEYASGQGYELDGYSYDWDFIPAVLNQLDWEKLVDDNQYTGDHYQPEPETFFPHVQRLFSADHWITAARQAAKKQWGYPEMVDDFEDIRDYSEPAHQWVKRIGEKYDLSPAGEWL